MNPLGQQLLRGMIQDNVEQGLSMLDIGDHATAITHLQEAISQIEHLRDSEEPPQLPQSEQSTLDI
jgi:hypothetical protein